MNVPTQAPNPQAPELLTVPDAVEYTKTFTGSDRPALTRETLYAMVKTGQVKSVGNRRRVFIVRASLERVLRGEA